jgi:hypothetical protein
MMTDTTHTPTPEFRAQLEWEIARTLRREERLAVHRREQRRRRLRVAGIVAISLGIGTATGLAPAQVRDAARRDSLLDAARAELAIVALRWDLAKAQLADATRKANVGVIGPEGLAAAQADLNAAEARVARQQMNIEEIQAAARPPVDDLNAPLVNGRDFVRQRLELDVRNAQQKLATAQQSLADIERRARAGVATDVERQEARLAVLRDEVSLDVLATRLSSRRAFLENGTSVDTLTRRLDRVQLQEDTRVAQLSLQLARARLEAVERQKSIGAASDLDVMRAQVDVKERELELSQLAKRLQLTGGARRDSIP